MRCSPTDVLRVSCLALVVLAASCIEEPRFDLRDEDPPIGDRRAVPVSSDGADAHASAGGDAADEPMVLVPSTVLSAADAISPSAPAAGSEEKDGRGKSKDAGAPDAGVPPSTSQTTVAAFWLDEREVGAASYARCVRAGACTAAASDAGCTLAAGLDTHPIDCVSLEQARGYCAWRGKRLPTNDEWTAASAGATGRPYAWGTDAPSSDRLNACGTECGSPSMYEASDAYPRTAPRGAFPLGRSPEGALDLAGNVAEWVELGGTGVVRGGSFEDVDVAAVSATAVRDAPAGGADVAIGFRCAKDR